MNNMRPRLIIISIIILLVSLACKTGEQIARDKAINAAQTAVSGETAANVLVGATQLENVAPQLFAIENTIQGAKGSWMYISDCQKLAVFVAHAGRMDGANYYFLGVVDLETAELVPDNANVFYDLGIDFRQLRTLEDITAALRSRGFVEMTPAALPTLYQTLKLALSFISKLGTATVDIILAPAGALTPQQLDPWCTDNPEAIQCLPDEERQY